MQFRHVWKSGRLVDSGVRHIVIIDHSLERTLKKYQRKQSGLGHPWLPGVNFGEIIATSDADVALGSLYPRAHLTA